jgi:RNA polymerase sigma-70 factor (ECF subfamily)
MPVPESDFDRLLDEDSYSSAWRYACRLSRTREDAEDLLQESLMRAHRGLAGLRRAEAFRPWLLSIMRRCWISGARRRRPQFVDSFLFQDFADTQACDALSLHMAEALSRLPAAQQEILELAYLDGLSLEETGALLGVAPRVAGQRLYRARRALRRALGSREELDPAGELK